MASSASETRPKRRTERAKVSRNVEKTYPSALTSWAHAGPAPAATVVKIVPADLASPRQWTEMSEALAAREYADWPGSRACHVDPAAERRSRNSPAETRSSPWPLHAPLRILDYATPTSIEDEVQAVGFFPWVGPLHRCADVRRRPAILARTTGAPLLRLR